ncbi:hypothetical protein [Cedecea sp.]
MQMLVGEVNISVNELAQKFSGTFSLVFPHKHKDRLQLKGID